MKSALDAVMAVILQRFQASEGQYTGFGGILLDGWEIFPLRLLTVLCDVLRSFGLKVYLETAQPSFLQDIEAIAPVSVSGLVIRNGLIHGDGRSRDCFDMESLRTTIKAFVSQSCLRDFQVFAWETVDDTRSLSSAVLTRTYTWCNFYSVIPWIGPSSALVDPSVEVVPFEPLGAFDWLKDSRVMELHELWKSNRAVSLSFPSSHYRKPAMQ